MTDKDKIREEVERLFNHIKDSNSESDSGAFYYLKDLLNFIDSLQEDPVSEDLEEELNKWQIYNDYPTNYDGLIKLAHHFANWQKEQLMKDAVSEDLEKASKEWLRPQLDKSYEKYGENKMMELTHFDGYAMLEAIEFGAKWKDEQFEKNRLKHCNSITNEQAELEQGFIDQHLAKYDRMPTFLDAIEYGMEIGKKNPKSHKGKGEECAECADYWKKKGIEIGKKRREEKI